MKYRKTFTKAFEEVKSRNLKEQEEQTEFSKDDVEKLKDEITQLKLQLQQAKDKTSKPVPNMVHDQCLDLFDTLQSHSQTLFQD